jgi:hypothetical protein
MISPKRQGMRLETNETSPSLFYLNFQFRRDIMVLRHLQRVKSRLRLPRTAPSGCLVREFKPVPLRIRGRSTSSMGGTTSMSLQEKIQFLHEYSACDVVTSHLPVRQAGLRADMLRSRMLY